MIAVKLTEVITEIERFKGYLDEDMILRIKIAISRLPTIDAVEVVRCKDCKHNWVTSYNHGVQDEPRCKFTNYKFGLDDYCSRGERREDEVD